MRATAVIHPTWPLGTKFIDTKSRTFEVTKVIMGYPEQSMGYEVECHNGWIVAAELGGHPQTRAGFVDVDNPDKLIIESVDKLDQYEANGHLRRI